MSVDVLECGVDDDDVDGALGNGTRSELVRERLLLSLELVSRRPLGMEPPSRDRQVGRCRRAVGPLLASQQCMELSSRDTRDVEPVLLLDMALSSQLSLDRGDRLEHD